MLSFFQKIIDAVLPPRCLKCGKVLNGESGLCADCFNEIDFIAKPYCKKCGRPFAEVRQGEGLVCGECMKKRHSPFRLNRSAVKYNEHSKNLILAFKFMDKTDNAPLLAKWLKLAGKDIFEAGVDMIIPVPLHYMRLLKRRYNQSSLLARELGRLSGVAVDYSSVVRHRHTRPQVEFSGSARVKNIKGAFTVKHPEKIKGKRVVLIDDVMTTGSTLKECALALKKAGAKSVDTLTVARVV